MAEGRDDGALTIVLEAPAGRDALYGVADELPHPSGTIAENVMLGSEPTRFGLIRSGELRRRAEEVLRPLGVPAGIDGPVASLDPIARRIVALAHLVVRAETIGASRILLDDAQDEVVAEDMPRWSHAVRQASRRMPITVLASTFEGWEVSRTDSPGTGESPPTTVSDRPALSVEALRVAHPVSDERIVIADASFTADGGRVTGIVGTHAHELLASIHGASYGTVLAGSAHCGTLDLTAITAERAEEAGVVFATGAPLMFDAGAVGGVASQVSAGRLRQLARLGLIDATRAYRPADRVSFLRRVVPTRSAADGMEELLPQILEQGVRIALLPDVLSGLSAGGREERIRMLRRIAAAGTAVVMTGSPEDVADGADAAYTLVRGHMRRRF